MNKISINGGPYQPLPDYPMPKYKPHYCFWCGRECFVRLYHLSLCHKCRPLKNHKNHPMVQNILKFWELERGKLCESIKKKS